MPDTELFLKEKLHIVYQVWYAAWVHWWPLWRRLFSERSIQHKWQKFDLIKQGQIILDYGCGTGSFTMLAAEQVGAKGKVYALDCFPRQLTTVAEQSKKKGLGNIETILSDYGTDLDDKCVDTVWVCDVLHEIKQRRETLEELHRVLKTEGTLAIYDGMRDRVLEYTTGLFSLVKKDGKLFKFIKIS